VGTKLGRPFVIRPQGPDAGQNVFGIIYKQIDSDVQRTNTIGKVQVAGAYVSPEIFAGLDPAEYPRLLAPILSGDTDVVFGTRNFWKGSRLITKAANIFLSQLTSLLFGSHVSDMETAYKVMRRSVVEPIRLRAVGFELEPELTAKLLRLGHQIFEVPLQYYNPRTEAEGKKIGWTDGFKAIFFLFKYRMQKTEEFLDKPMLRVLPPAKPKQEESSSTKAVETAG